jgi:urocanate hydratase
MTKQFTVTTGSNLRCRGWRQEGLLRLLENVLAVGEDPANLVVYAALGKAARDWPSHDRIVETLKTMADDETLIVQSGKPIGVIKTHDKAPIVIMANCNMVGQWAKAENFYELQKKNLICWGGLTAGDWQYIGSQGVIQGTYEIFMRIAERHFDNSLTGRLILTAGLGGMGGAQPLAGRLAGGIILCVEIDPDRIAKRIANGYLDVCAETLDQAIAMIDTARREGRAMSIGLNGNAADIYEALLDRRVIPDIVTDQTSAHDLVYGYVPANRSLAEARRMREDDPKTLMQESRATIVRHVRAMLGFKQAGAVVFDNGNLIRTQAFEGGVEYAFDIPIFTEAYLRPLFARAIGPFRWIALSNDREDIRKIDDHLLQAFPDNLILTERMRDGSDAIADWPLLNAMAMCSSQADLVAIHSGGGGYSGYMTSAGVTVIADGTNEADERIELSMTNDTSLGVMRYADAGYPESFEEVESKGLRHFKLP